MNELKPFPEIGEIAPDFEFEAQVLAVNQKETDLLNKRGYKIKKSVWNGLIAS